MNTKYVYKLSPEGLKAIADHLNSRGKENNKKKDTSLFSNPSFQIIFNRNASF
jgi:hypothetical protein